jgi:SWI/SNF-related matrix-associated actin-dependent regulator 1 of chromatin subfamily A
MWVKELKRWWPAIKVTIIETWKDVPKITSDGAFIISYSKLSASKTSGYDYTLGLRKYLLSQPFDMSILDEVHYLKTPKSIRTQAVLKTLKPQLGWCLPMSGTPTPNHAGELYSVLASVFPDTIRKPDGSVMKPYEFEGRYCRVVGKWFHGRQVRVIEGSQNLDELRAKLAPIMVRRRKVDVLKDLPEMSFDTYPVSAPEAPVWGEWRGKSDDELLNDEHVMRMRRLLGMAKVPGAVDAICTMLDGSDRKALVFAHHTDVIDGLMEGLGNWMPVKIDGRDGTPARDRAIATFLHDPRCRVFIGNIQAAGTTITLVGPGCNVSDVFFVESSFSPGDNVQAASRIHRIGQKDAVQVWFLCAYGTYDERVAEIVARKASDFHELFG